MKGILIESVVIESNDDKMYEGVLKSYLSKQSFYGQWSAYK